MWEGEKEVDYIERGRSGVGISVKYKTAALEMTSVWKNTVTEGKLVWLS